MRSKIIGFGLWLLLAPLLLAAGQPGQRNADDYYETALQAYLLGDLDRAFSLDSKSLEMDPGHPKAKALFRVLTSERGWAQKTVIWIGGKSIAMAKTEGLRRTGKQKTPISPGPDQEKIKELERRIQVISLLVSADSQEKYLELRASQAQWSNRLEEIAGKSDDRAAVDQRHFGENERGFGILYFLSLLALIVSCIALWANLKTRKRLNDQ